MRPPRVIEDGRWPSAELEIRELTPADLTAMLQIERVSFSTPWQRNTFEGLLARSDTDVLGAIRDGQLVGYAVCWTVIDQAELGNVAVAPAFRGQGAGRRLVEEVLRRAHRRGARECFLEVRESNHGAQALYESMGFVTIGRRRRYYTHPVEDALVMRIELD